MTDKFEQRTNLVGQMREAVAVLIGASVRAKAPNPAAMAWSADSLVAQADAWEVEDERKLKRYRTIHALSEAIVAHGIAVNTADDIAFRLVDAGWTPPDNVIEPEKN